MNELLLSSETILDSLSEGVYVCDRDRRIVFWSKSAARTTGWQPEDVVGKRCLEDILCHVDKDGHRLCGVFDARDGTLCFVGAGGPPPLIIRKNLSVEKLESSGLSLGFIEDIPEDVQYKEKTVQLNPADAILLLSDGAFEIQNASEEMLGIDGFVQILKNLDYPQAHLDMDRLEKKLLKFSNDIRLQDDITIIEIRYRGQQAS